eukprot:g9726.t1
MIVALTLLSFPPHFQPGIHDAGEDLSIPAATRVYNLLHAAREKPEFQNSTTYRFASKNGKYGLRVCTDLTQEAFEKATGLLETDRKWDNMDSTGIKKFLDSGCANSSVLSFNSNCNVRSKGGAYYSLSGATGSWPKRASDFGFPGRGQCGKPLVFGGKKELLFTDPDPGYGWLWTMMIRDPSVGPWKISEFGGFPEDKNLTHSNCTEKICNTLDTQDHACDSNKNRVCFDSDEGQCLSTDTCTGPAMTNCTCNTYYEFVPGKPEWIINNEETYGNDKCKYMFGPLDADLKDWKHKRATDTPCLRRYVFSYGYENKAISGLFIAGAILRIGNQIMSLYWGCTEDDPDYRVLFTTETLFRIISICTKGLDYVNKVIDTKWQTGWPWMIGFLDSAFVAIATLGCAIGADPFPDLIQGRTTMFFLWLSAIRECLKLLYKFYSAYQKKPWIIQEKSEQVEICGVTIPWCGPVKEPEEAYKDGKATDEEGAVDASQVEMGEK